MKVLLVSTYELGHQPFHLASSAQVLLEGGHQVICHDLAVREWEPDLIEQVDLVAIAVPMHTAMRLGVELAKQINRQKPLLPLCLYGLYAHIAVDDDIWVEHCIVGQYEQPLLAWVNSHAYPNKPTEVVHPLRTTKLVVNIERHPHPIPARSLLNPIQGYARLLSNQRTPPNQQIPAYLPTQTCPGDTNGSLAGYTEASRGCSHKCRHCPVPVVYNGRVRSIETDVVMADIDNQVQMGATHITFGDPDFLNLPHHAVTVVEELARSFPRLSFDITAKVSHIIKYEHLWPKMSDAGCLFVVSAFESLNDMILEKLDKGHTAKDEITAVEILRRSQIEPRPSFLPFTPWSTVDDIADIVDFIGECDLVGNVDPVQYTIWLLLPPGSLLLDKLTEEMPQCLGSYSREKLTTEWKPKDTRLYGLHKQLGKLVTEYASNPTPLAKVYEQIKSVVYDETTRKYPPMFTNPLQQVSLRSNIPVDDRPRLSEPWFCCAEPTQYQLAMI